MSKGYIVPDVNTFPPPPEPNPAPTPRCDAKCNDYSGVLMFTGGEQYVPADFARTLERELAASEAANRKASEDALLMRDGLLKQLAAKDREIERRKAQLEMWTSAAMDGNAAIAQQTARAEKAEQLAREAAAELAKTKIDLAGQLEWGNRVEAERDALRAEVEHIKAWANAKADEAQDLRATLLAREGELDELQRQLAEAGKDRERLETVIRWALGEVEDFPTWPDSVTIKGNPKFWWRTELRKRFDTARAGEGRP